MHWAQSSGKDQLAEYQFFSDIADAEVPRGNPMAKAKTHSTLESLFRANYTDLVKSSVRICGNQPQAEDVVQQVFLKFHEQNGLEKAHNPIAYLRRAVVTRTLNAIRDQKRTVFMEDTALSSAAQQLNEDNAIDIEDMKARLSKAIDDLPARARIILVLHRFEGLSYKEIAAELDIAPKTVENQLSRAIKLLRKALPKVLNLVLSLNFLGL